jgi:hypothetical protein
VADEAWLAGSAAPKKSAPRGRSAKTVVFGAVALLAMSRLAFGTYEAGVSEGDRAGHERGVADGYDSAHAAGFSEERAEGYPSGREAGYDDGKADGYASGYSSGWTDDCLAVFTALGDDTAAAWSDVDGMFDSTLVSTVDRFSCY